MLVYGLTGGIASGKSTVAKMFRDLDVPVVDADAIARAVVEPGQPALAAIAERFGHDVVRADGSLDRAKLGAVVFSDPGARRDLEEITHPRIAEASAAAFAELAAQGASLALYEAALLVENGSHENFAGLIVVAAPREIQLARLMKRDGLDEASATQRLDAQLPLKRKLDVATFVIDSATDLESTRARVAEVHQQLSQRAS